MALDAYIPSTGDIRFDVLRSYGYDGTPVSSNLTIDIASGADNTMAKVLHNNSVQPTITVPGGVTLHQAAGTYVPNEDNEIYFIAHKNNAGVITRVTFSFNPNLL